MRVRDKSDKQFEQFVYEQVHKFPSYNAKQNLDFAIGINTLWYNEHNISPAPFATKVYALCASIINSMTYCDGVLEIQLDTQ